MVEFKITIQGFHSGDHTFSSASQFILRLKQFIEDANYPRVVFEWKMKDEHGSSFHSTGDMHSEQFLEELVAEREAHDEQ